MTKYVVSGYIGFDNFGDEAIANVLISHLKNNSAEKELLTYEWTNLGDTRPHTENLVKLISRAKKKVDD